MRTAEALHCRREGVGPQSIRQHGHLLGGNAASTPVALAAAAGHGRGGDDSDRDCPNSLQCGANLSIYLGTLGRMDEVTLLLASPFATVVAAVFGAAWGSFFNVCIARIPAGQSIVRPGSRCGSCGTPIRPADNVPLLSYFLLRGRCRACKQPFSARYPLVEALGALVAAGLWITFVAGDPGETVAIRVARFAVYFAFAGVLIVLSFIDLASMRLPDVITLPAIPIFFISGFATHHVPWLQRLIGLGAGYLFLRLIADFYYYVLKREGLGLGDAKLLALIGALLGWRALLFVLMVGPLAGVLIGGPIVIWSRHKQPAAAADQPLRHVAVPFGPFLAGAALLYVFLAPRFLALMPG
jgi:leader peptidase (prepilin peptidase)/N-methyltransferase